MKKRTWILKPIGDLISKLMEKEDVDLPTLAEITGLSRGYLSDILKGKADNPSLEVLVRIATALQVDFRISGQQLDKQKGKPVGLVYESEFLAAKPSKEDREIIDLEVTEAALTSPAVKLLARLLGDRKIPLQERKQMEKYAIQLIEWMAGVVKQQEADNSRR